MEHSLPNIKEACTTKVINNSEKFKNAIKIKSRENSH